MIFPGFSAGGDNPLGFGSVPAPQTLLSELPSVSLRGDHVVVDAPGADAVLPVKTLSAAQIDWFKTGRRAAYRSILGATGPVRTFSAHLPVVVTWGSDGLFPCNCGNKGVGFLPQAERLSECIESFERVMHDTRGLPWEQSLQARIRTVSQFYLDDDLVDYRLVTGLEIFERQTFKNLCKRPFSSLLFTGEGPQYMSFQLNCAVEVIRDDDPRHKFVMLARTMFENDDFHITQQNFPYAYLFWITDILDKTPFQVQAPTIKAEVNENGVTWEPGALSMISRAPAMIQDFIKQSVEKYAAARGIAVITAELVGLARDAYMGQKQAMQRGQKDPSQSGHGPGVNEESDDE